MTTHSLVDPTEMYLRTIFELEEERVVPLRARIAERLQQSGPTVSQTVARMQRDGLVRVAGDRRLVMTESGRRRAVRVMRKHRLAECLLVDVIGLQWEDVHVEASRWQHVMSDAVANRLTEILGYPATCPHGSPIPAWEQNGAVLESVLTMTDAATAAESTVLVVRISELLQNDPSVLLRLKRAGIQPDHTVTVVATEGGVRVTGDERATFPHELSDHIFVETQGGV
ncbi:metal-dependent transcriptional regulator [Streptomyces coffeae]|uniref:Metal-dependent transcriptional regulator n=1 Tax=Streptomyces coffeae TaxID=621382 RepID=A0ABS1NET7_9ACTN|nr:metal-dependent transcriptional regulator [Streptomyces coffeae]MBL1098490.1 metal-dependent transcriptional regulator [Streptomyces coffeae]